MNLKEFDGLKKNVDSSSREVEKLSEKLQTAEDKLASMGQKDSGRAKVEQSIQVINKQLDRAVNKSADATDAMEKFLNQRGVSSTGADGRVNLDYARGEIEKQASVQSKAVETTKGSFKKLKNESDKTFKSINKESKGGTSAIASFGKRILSVAKSVFVFNLISKAFQSLVKLAQEGFQNLAQYSTNYNKTMSDFKSQLATLKNNLASAFEPIANIIIPLLSQMIGWLNIAVEKISAFFSALGGKSTFTKAKKQVIDYAKAVESASNKLASFDDIQVLDQDGGSGGEATGANAFETAEIDAGTLAFADKMKEQFDKIKAWIAEVKESFSTWWSGLDFSPLIASFDRLKESVEPLTTNIGKGLMWVFENVLQPIGTWTIEEALPASFDMLAAAIEAVNNILEELKPTFEDIYNNVLVPIGAFIGEQFVAMLGIAKQAIQELSDKVSEKSESIQIAVSGLIAVFSVVFEAFKNIARLVRGLLSGVLTFAINLVGNLIDLFADIITFFKDTFAGDFDKALTDICNIGIDILNTIIFAVRDAINMVIRGINSLSFDVPEWIPGIGGKHFGFDISELTWAGIPRLAEGGITERATTALIGESGREAVLPLENNTAWMDTLAEKIGSGNVTIKFDGSLSQLARVLNPVLIAENSRVGTRLIVE